MLAGTVLAGTVLAGTVLAGTVLAGTVLAGTVLGGTVLTGARRAVTVAALIVPLLALAACSQPAGGRSGPAPAAVTMDDCGAGQVRPAIVELICATNSITARGLTWSAWGKPVAIAEGAAVVDLCAYEDCHTGSYGSFPVVLIASRIVSCGRSTRAYSRLQYVFVGPSPFQGVPANMKFPNFEVGTSRPSPGDQIISLGC